MNDNIGRREGRQASGDSENSHVSKSCLYYSRKGPTQLTTNNRAVDLDRRPYDSIAGGLTEQIG